MFHVEDTCIKYRASLRKPKSKDQWKLPVTLNVHIVTQFSCRKKSSCGC